LGWNEYYLRADVLPQQNVEKVRESKSSAGLMTVAVAMNLWWRQYEK